MDSGKPRRLHKDQRRRHFADLQHEASVENGLAPEVAPQPVITCTDLKRSGSTCSNGSISEKISDKTSYRVRSNRIQKLRKSTSNNSKILDDDEKEEKKDENRSGSSTISSTSDDGTRENKGDIVRQATASKQSKQIPVVSVSTRMQHMTRRDVSQFRRSVSATRTEKEKAPVEVAKPAPAQVVKKPSPLRCSLSAPRSLPAKEKPVPPEEVATAKADTETPLMKPAWKKDASHFRRSLSASRISQEKKTAAATPSKIKAVTAPVISVTASETAKSENWIKEAAQARRSLSAMAIKKKGLAKVVTKGDKSVEDVVPEKALKPNANDFSKCDSWIIEAAQARRALSAMSDKPKISAPKDEPPATAKKTYAFKGKKQSVVTANSTTAKPANAIKGKKQALVSANTKSLSKTPPKKAKLVPASVSPPAPHSMSFIQESAQLRRSLSALAAKPKISAPLKEPIVPKKPSPGPAESWIKDAAHIRRSLSASRAVKAAIPVEKEKPVSPPENKSDFLKEAAEFRKRLAASANSKNGDTGGGKPIVSKPKGKEVVSSTKAQTKITEAESGGNSWIREASQIRRSLSASRAVQSSPRSSKPNPVVTTHSSKASPVVTKGSLGVQTASLRAIKSSAAKRVVKSVKTEVSPSSRREMLAQEIKNKKRASLTPKKQTSEQLDLEQRLAEERKAKEIAAQAERIALKKAKAMQIIMKRSLSTRSRESNDNHSLSSLDLDTGSKSSVVESNIMSPPATVVSKSTSSRDVPAPTTVPAAKAEEHDGSELGDDVNDYQADSPVRGDVTAMLRADSPVDADESNFTSLFDDEYKVVVASFTESDDSSPDVTVADDREVVEKVAPLRQADESVVIADGASTQAENLSTTVNKQAFDFSPFSDNPEQESAIVEPSWDSTNVLFSEFDKGAKDGNTEPFLIGTLDAANHSTDTRQTEIVVAPHVLNAETSEQFNPLGWPISPNGLSNDNSVTESSDGKIDEPSVDDEANLLSAAAEDTDSCQKLSDVASPSKTERIQVYEQNVRDEDSSVEEDSLAEDNDDIESIGYVSQNSDGNASFDHYSDEKKTGELTSFGTLSTEEPASGRMRSSPDKACAVTKSTIAKFDQFDSQHILSESEPLGVPQGTATFHPALEVNTNSNESSLAETEGAVRREIPLALESKVPSNLVESRAPTLSAPADQIEPHVQLDLFKREDSIHPGYFAAEEPMPYTTKESSPCVLVANGTTASSSTKDNTNPWNLTPLPPPPPPPDSKKKRKKKKKSSVYGSVPVLLPPPPSEKLAKWENSKLKSKSREDPAIAQDTNVPLATESRSHESISNPVDFSQTEDARESLNEFDPIGERKDRLVSTANPELRNSLIVTNTIGASGISDSLSHSTSASTEVEDPSDSILSGAKKQNLSSSALLSSLDDHASLDTPLALNQAVRQTSANAHNTEQGSTFGVDTQQNPERPYNVAVSQNRVPSISSEDLEGSSQKSTSSMGPGIGKIQESDSSPILEMESTTPTHNSSSSPEIPILKQTIGYGNEARTNSKDDRVGVKQDFVLSEEVPVSNDDKSSSVGTTTTTPDAAKSDSVLSDPSPTLPLNQESVTMALSPMNDSRSSTKCESSRRMIYPEVGPSPFTFSVISSPDILKTILSFLGDPVAVCRVKQVNKTCRKFIDDNEHTLMRDAVRAGGMHMSVRPYFWLWVTLSKKDVARDAERTSDGTDLATLERAGREGKWNHVIDRDVSRAFGNLPPHKTGARLRTDSIVRALVTWGKSRLMKRGGKGGNDGPRRMESTDSGDVSVTPTDTVSEWGGVTPAGSFCGGSFDGSDIPASTEETKAKAPSKKGRLFRKKKQESPVNEELALGGNALTDNMKSELQEKLRFILHTLAAAHPDVGYCQGMDYVVAHILRILQDTIRWKAANGTMPSIVKSSVSKVGNVNSPTGQDLTMAYAEIDKTLAVEETCFLVMDSFFTTYSLKHFYWPELRCLKTCCRVFEKLIQIKLPVLADHFENQELNVGLFALGWFQTLFLYLPSMPSATVCHMWDIWLVERSFKIFFRVGTAILFLSQPTLLNYELEGMMSYLNTFPDATLLSPDILIACALQIKVTNRMLMEIEQDVKDTTMTC